MAQGQRYHCDRCGESVYNCLIEGVRVPIVVYMVAGVIPDYPTPFDDSAPDVKMPQMVREMMDLPESRVEWCVACLAEVFGLRLVTAEETEAEAMTARSATPIAPVMESAPVLDAVPRVERSVIQKRRVMMSIAKDNGRTIPPLSDKAIPSVTEAATVVDAVLVPNSSTETTPPSKVRGPARKPT